MTTTTLPFIPIKDQVAEAVVRSGRQQIACFSAPTTCDVKAMTATVGTYRANLTRGVQSLIDHRYEAREDPKDQFYTVITGVVVGDDDRSATVVACVWDPVFVWERGGAPDGRDVLINSVKSSSQRQHQVVLDSGEWRISEFKTLSEVDGANTCAAK